MIDYQNQQMTIEILLMMSIKTTASSVYKNQNSSFIIVTQQKNSGNLIIVTQTKFSGFTKSQYLKQNSKASKISSFKGSEASKNQKLQKIRSFKVVCVIALFVASGSETKSTGQGILDQANMILNQA